MNIVKAVKAHPTQDGDGVKISRVHDFQGLSMDPFLMMDEIRSDDQADFIGGFPPHPHRGIETFTYMIDGGFEHRDQMGNVKAIRGGDIQWMSTGFGVVHSEMPLVDESDRIHGFQIWLNMPASEKLRPARYYDSTDSGIEELTDHDGNMLRVLAGQWGINGNSVTANLDDLAGDGGVADVRLQKNAALTINLPERERVLMLIHTGSLADSQFNHGTLIHLKPNQEITVTGGTEGLGALIFYGNPINEQIAHMGPFVMNTQAELQQAIADYRSGKFGQIAV